MNNFAGSDGMRLELPMKAGISLCGARRIVHAGGVRP